MKTETDYVLFNPHDISGVILAGGKSQRMGGHDKGLIKLFGKPMVQHVVDALQPEVGALFINANRNVDQYEKFEYPVISDNLSGFQGPLAGMASGMKAATTPYIVTAPCDCPLVETGLVRRLYSACIGANADIAVAHDGERAHPVFALMRSDLLDDLLQFLDSGDRKIDRWYAKHNEVSVSFADVPEWFRNVNNPEEQAELEMAHS